MKKILFLLSTIFAVQTAMAQVLFTEYFNYELDDLEGQGGWVVSGKTGDNTGKSPVVKSGSLTKGLYDGSGNTKVAYFNSTDQEVSGKTGDTNNTRSTFTPFSATNIAIGDSVYTAFLANFSEQGGTSGKEIFVYNKDNTNRGRVWIKVYDKKIQFGITKSGKYSDVDKWLPEEPISRDETVLLVVKYINKSHTTDKSKDSYDEDEFYLYVNPDPTKSESENADFKLTASDNNSGGGASLLRIGFRQTQNFIASYAGLRVAKSWGEAVAVGINIGETGWATFCATQNFTLSGNLKAYVVNKSNASTVSLQEVSVIPANQGVLLKGDKNAKYTLIPTDVGADVTTNLLQANLTATTLAATTDDYTNYILVPDDEDGVKFAPSSGNGTLAANRAYLQLPTPADPAREYVLSFNDDELTGIKAVESSKEKSADVYYDLSGRRVAQPTKGLYIMNGKKYIVK